MSKQMDFQMSGHVLAAMIDLVELKVGKVPKDRLEEALVEQFPDEKQRKRARVSIIVLVKCYDAERDYADIKNVIVWRDETGKPNDIQIEFNRR